MICLFIDPTPLAVNLLVRVKLIIILNDMFTDSEMFSKLGILRCHVCRI